MNKKYEFEVALSFAGEDRVYVDKVAECLKKNKIDFFYDANLEAYLWGKDLIQHLDDVYKNKAKYCVIFISKYYAEKLWTNHELKSIQERTFAEKGEEYILPAIFDDTPIPGIRSTMGRVDLRKKTPEQLCKLILEKLGLDFEPLKAQEIQNIEYDIQIPKVKKQFTDLDKKQLLIKAFEYLKGHFKVGLSKLENEYDFINTEYNEISNSKLVARVYRYGKSEAVCKIWIGGSLYDRDAIGYLEGRSEIDTQNDNSYNDIIHVNDNGHEMYFSASMTIGFTLLGLNAQKLLVEGVAKYLWGKFTNRLEY